MSAEKSERRMVSMPPEWWAAFARAAARDGLPLSTWMGECCKANIPVNEAAKLGERRAVGRPKKPAK